jgi:lysophospholipase L1-like esterase
MTQRSWPLRLRFLAFTLVAGGALAFIVGEVGLRLFSPEPSPDSLRARSLEYEPTLFARHAFPQEVQQKSVVRGQSLRIDERGYRGHGFAVPKPEETRRIVVLGGSAAFDAGQSIGRDWPHLVEARLRALGHPEVEVVSAATPGYASWDSLGRLYAEAWMFQPDYVVVYHSWNDIKYFRWLTPGKSLFRGFRPEPVWGNPLRFANPFLYYQNGLDRFLAHSQVYLRVRSAYWWRRLGPIRSEGLVPEIVAAGENASAVQTSYGDWGPRQFELNLRLIADASRDIGAVPVFLTQARLASSVNTAKERAKIDIDYVGLSHEELVRAFDDCDAVISKAARAEEAPLLDVSRLLTGRDELFLDHVHLTPAGSEAVAELVTGFLVQLLANGES